MKTSIRRQGFTLVEIMLVVAVIGILAMIAIPKVVTAVNNAKQRQAEVDLTIIAAAINQLTADTGMFPSTSGSSISHISDDYSTINQEVQDLSTADAGLLSCATNRFGARWQGPYLDKLPTDPWGHRYFFDPDYNVGPDNASEHVGAIVRGGGKGQASTVNRAVVGSYGPNGVGLNTYDSDDIYLILK